LKEKVKIKTFIRQLLFTALVISSTSAFAQSSNDEDILPLLMRVGGFAGYGLNYHKTSANVFDCPECGTFSDGTGSGIAFNAFAERPVYEKMIDVVLAVGYAQRGGSFGESVTADLPVRDPNSGEYVPLKRKHNYSADLGFLTADLGVKISPLAEYPIYFRTGINYNVALSNGATYEQTEQITSPQGLLYPETHRTDRLVGSGVIPGLKSPLNIASALGYPLPIGATVTASPEVRYYFPLTNINASNNWKISTLEAGVALRWKIFYTPDDLDEQPKATIPPAIVERNKPIAPTVTVSSTTADPVEITETIVTETFPILPYVFFDSANTTLLSRYPQIGIDDRDNFDERNLPHNSLDAYHNILNVLGQRMLMNRAATLSLGGTTDGKEVTNSEDAKKLAYKRAEAVRDYLTTLWGIDPSRIEVKVLSAPTFPSSQEYREGYEENRRVEISSNDDNLLKPLLHERFREHTISPRELNFKLSGVSRVGVANWKFTAYSQGAPVWETSGIGTPPNNVTWTLDKKAAAAIANHLIGKDSIRCELAVTGKDGGFAKSSYEVSANKAVNPFELSRLSLIVFDFDKSAITPQNERMISQFVSKSMFPTSTSSITGSTDNLGEAKHNQQLSEDRAFAVRDIVLLEKPDAQIASTKGVGPQLKYPNDTPEGRYYCRTVTVEVQTPLEDVTQ